MRDAPWRKLGGFGDDNDAFARIYNNLLLYEYIITLHQCTFSLLFAFFCILIYQLPLHADSA